MQKETQQTIKNRMLQKAANLWNIPVAEINSTIDPVISLLMTACASELEKINTEINASQTRSTEQLIQLMTPDNIYGPHPAHSIAQAHPATNTFEIPKEFQFYTNHKENDGNVNTYKNIFFSPLEKQLLVDGAVQYTITEREVVELTAKNNKTILGKLPKSYNPNPATVYLGITSENAFVAQGLSMYFELQEVSNSALFYHHLQHAKWYLGDTLLETKSGFCESDNQNDLLYNTILAGTPSRTQTIEQEVKQYYQKFFVTIKDQLSFSKPSVLPKALEKALESTKIELPNDITWLRVEFSGVVDNTILRNVFCSLNTFPVLNRKWNSFTYQLKEFIHILPIITESLFLDIQSITNSSGEAYQHIDQAAADSKGTYHIRKEQVGKLDTRSAKEHIRHLLTLLKDESASFSFLNREFLQKQLKNMNQNIALLEQRLDEAPEEENHCQYIHIKPLIKRDLLTVNYWSTDGVTGNLIGSGTVLEPYTGGAIKQNSSKILKPVFGGKNELTMEERMFAYRKVLLTKNRIVTKEDIKALCFANYGTNIKTVAIVKSFTKDIALNRGLVQCIEIQITSVSNSSLSNEEWEFMNTNLLQTLNEQAIQIFPYTVKILKKVTKRTRKVRA